jgi:MFS family permease
VLSVLIDYLRKPDEFFPKQQGEHFMGEESLDNLITETTDTVEAVINPVVATVYSKEKTKWLNILHAGWPGGMVLGGLLILILMPGLDWRWKVGLVLIPAAVYGLMMIKAKFPVHERVKAGVPYKAMLQEAGIIGLVMLSKTAGILIFIAATIYALGKTFFWPTMLGVAAERFPKGGALTLNAIGGIGMLSVGGSGAVFLGNIQDRQIDRELVEQKE